MKDYKKLLWVTLGLSACVAVAIGYHHQEYYSFWLGATTLAFMAGKSEPY